MSRQAVSGTNITVGFEDDDGGPLIIEVLCDDATMRLYLTDDEARELAAILIEATS